MSNLIEYQNCALDLDPQFDRESCLPQKGQRVVYEDKEAEVIRVTPLMVIKTKDRVVCGALQNRLTCAQSATNRALPLH